MDLTVENVYNRVHAINAEMNDYIKSIKHDPNTDLMHDDLIEQHERILRYKNAATQIYMACKASGTLRNNKDIYYTINVLHQTINDNLAFIQAKERLYMNERRLA